MEKVTKYRNVKFESNPLKVKTLISLPLYDECDIIEESTEESVGILMLEMKQKK